MSAVRRVSAAGAAVGLAVAATLWLALWPCAYSGVSTTPTVPGEGGAPVELRTCASLIQVNGAWVLALLFVPVVIGGAGYLAARMQRRGLVWGAMGLLLAFCLVGAFSIGIYYMPSVAALAVAAARLKKKRTSRDGHMSVRGPYG